LTGFGRWSVFRKQDSEFLGWCGLGYRAELDEIDLGFRFHRRHWGQGYATEAAHAALQLGFSRHGLARIVGRAMRANVASQRVLSKLGMCCVGVFARDGHEWVQYEVTAAAYLSSVAGLRRSESATPVYNRAADTPDQPKDGL
jgi:[ribosomal protein S5]-alanine N-acetyltransferase